MSVDVSQLVATSNGVNGASSIVKAMRDIGEHESTGHLEAVVTATDIANRCSLTDEQEAVLVTQLQKAAIADGNEAVANADEFWLLAAIRARKGDITRALSLVDNYLKWRGCMGLDELTVASSPTMRSQLEQNIIFVPGHTDKEGRLIINMRIRNQDPNKFSAADTTRTISFVLEWTLRTYPAAQRNGVVIVNDMSQISWGNLDIRLPGVIQKAFSKTIPVRVASINAVNPPFFVKTVCSIVAGVLSRKMKARFRVFGKHDGKKFREDFAPDQILKDLNLGGTAEWTSADQQAWVERMAKDCISWPRATEYKEEVAR